MEHIELKQIIRDRIFCLNKQRSDISLNNPEIIEKTKKIILRKEFNDYVSLLNEINLEELMLLLTSDYISDLKHLGFYIKALNTKYGADLNNQPQIIEHINQILSRILEFLNKLENKNDEIRKTLDLLEKDIINLNSLMEKITNNSAFDERDLDTVVSVLIELDKRDKAIDLLIAFGETILKDNNNEIGQDDEIEEFIENENQEQVRLNLIETFKKYNLDFFTLNVKDQKSLVQNGNCHKIDLLLNLFKEYGVDLSESYAEDVILHLKSTAITQILLYSDVESLENVFKIAIEYGIFRVDSVGSDKRIIDFMLLLKNPSRFIKRKKRYHRRGNEIIDGIFGGEVVGCSDDFIKNLKFFVSLGVDPKKFCQIKKVPETPHKQILNNKKLFDLYDVSDKYLVKTLSCFSSSKPADAIDQYIELGCFDYILNNLSIVNFGPDDLRCYLINYALKQTDLDYDKIFSGERNELSFKYLRSNENLAEMTGLNHYRMVNKYSPVNNNSETRKLYEKLDAIVDKSNNSNTSIALGRKDSVIMLLDEMFLVKDENNNAILPSVYCFGEVELPNGKVWKINISRNKVVRIYNTLLERGIIGSYDLDAIMYVITKNSILTEEEYNIIYDSVSNAIKRRVH